MSVIWKLWDEFNIRNSTMIGAFDANPAVTVHHLAPPPSPPPPPPPSSLFTNWSGPYKGYIAGCAGPGPGSPPPPCASASTLAAAERACEAMPFAQCAGVTKEGPSYQLRQANLNIVSSGEVSWARNCSAEQTSCPSLKPRDTIQDPVHATVYVQKGVRALIGIILLTPRSFCLCLVTLFNK